MAFFKSSNPFFEQSIEIYNDLVDGPPTLGYFSPTLGGPPCLHSAVTSSRSDPFVIVRPPTLGGFEILQKDKIYNGLFQIQYALF